MKLALLVAIFIGSANAECPSDFVASITIPGKCYHVVTSDTYKFFDTVNYCRNFIYGSDILSIANGFENSEIASLVNSSRISSVWTGNAFYDNKSHWIATAAGNSSYSNWGPGGHNGLVARIDQTGVWLDDTPRSYAYPICQLYPDDPTTLPPPQITCPSGWWPSVSVRGKCYKDTYVMDFFSAIRTCLTTKVGYSRAELITLVSQLEMMEVGWAIDTGLGWVSLVNWEADDHWHWVETLHPTDYFGPNGPPTPNGGNCAFMGSCGVYALPCFDTHYTVCQYFPYESPAPTLHSLDCPQNGLASLTKPGTCYYILNQPNSFQSARNACQALNNGFDYNDLFVPRTGAEYQEFEVIVFNQISNSPVWLGLTSSNGSWGWIPGRTSNVTNFWCPGQPGNTQNSPDQCGFVFSTTQYNGNICWMTGDCTNPNAAVCQSSNTL